MTRTIPPLNPLHVFEVVARLGNFTRAAQELRVTQSAVSRQIATLEAYLGLKLFTREHQGIALTPAGTKYFDEIGPAFAAIASATGRLRISQSREALRLVVYPTFAAKWLIPRLSRFSALHPQIEIKLTTGIKPANFASQTVDLAIQLATPDQITDGHKLLFDDIMQPVCSPSYLAEHKLETVDDLATARLLHSHYRRSDWQDWLDDIGRRDLWHDGVEFPSSLLTYQAAIEGMGVAIGQTRLLAEEIKAGTLVPLFDVVKRDLAYFVMWEKGTEPNLKGRKFIRWLGDELGQTRPQ
ncbi:LysR substrate-binding domain-containing protein [Pelagibacterium lacus]|uniref:LysR family transcriptional regulator n=1 Tax=Pelagibacterium lacus TaxID=2282655 RepID=A0A369W6B4_9HYPH|nr:LysR substrate-binding domain-containing protein [Pelagibacterium lacus]RDE09559.1 LysR family transcriptional regulator [Pelagibacterium lacus]